MKLARVIGTGCLVVTMTAALVYWWFGTAVSERLWTWVENTINNDGQRVNLVSDVEAVIVILVSLFVAIAITFVSFKLIAKALSNRAP